MLDQLREGDVVVVWKLNFSCFVLSRTTQASASL
jgi:hypothetical protein